MLKKTKVEEKDKEDLYQSSQQMEELELKLQEAENQNNLLKELQNLKEESYYRFQMISSMQQLSMGLQELVQEIKVLRTDLLSSLDEEDEVSGTDEEPEN